MSATGLDVFDKTLQTTNIWLNEISDQIGPDRQLAWHVLGAVLRTLRDRVPPELAVHLGSQLPILVRGTYYDQWNISQTPEKMRTAEDFLNRVADKMRYTRPVDTVDATKAVLAVLDRHIPEGQIENIRNALPEDIRALWPRDQR